MDLTTDTIQLLLNTGKGTGGIVNPTNVPLLPFAVLPRAGGGFEIEPVSNELFVNPVSIDKTVKVYDSDSFVQYFGRYSNPSSRIFVDLKARLITAILDYHEAKTGDAHAPGARWGTHILEHVFRHTRTWESWIAKNTPLDARAATTFGHEEFADFMEEHLQDVLDLDRPAVQAMCDGIYATSTTSHNSKPTAGGRAIAFMKEDGVTAAGDVPIPRSIRIRVAPYEGTELITVICALRCGADQKGVKLYYRMLNIDTHMDDAVDAVYHKIKPLIKNHDFTKGTP